MAKPKGKLLSYTHSIRQKEINNFIGELGGIKVRQTAWGYPSFGQTRMGACEYNHHKDNYDAQPCFGKWWVRMSAHKPYSDVYHYTLRRCKEACWKEAIVVCVREFERNGDMYMTTHIAGECPYCSYIIKED